MKLHFHFQIFFNLELGKREKRTNIIPNNNK